MNLMLRRISIVGIVVVVVAALVMLMVLGRDPSAFHGVARGTAPVVTSTVAAGSEDEDANNIFRFWEKAQSINSGFP